MADSHNRRLNMITALITIVRNAKPSAHEESLIDRALHKCGGVKTKAADFLGINRNTLNKKVKELGIETAD